MLRVSLTFSSVFCLCGMMPAQASFAETVHIGSGHTQIIQLSSGKTSYRSRVRLRKRRAAARQKNIQIHQVSVKTPKPVKEPHKVAVKAKPTLALQPSNSDFRAKIVPTALAVTPLAPAKIEFVRKATEPRGVYEEFVSEIKAGGDPEKVLRYYTSSKRMTDFVKMMSKSEKAKKFGLMFIAKSTQCTDLTLIDEKVAGNKAVIQYKGKDICSKQSNPYQKMTETVEMVKEGGRWKIEMSMTNVSDLILLKVDLTNKTASKGVDLREKYDPQTVYESYLHLMKKEQGFKDAAEFFATKQKKASLLKLFNHPKEISDQTLQAVAKSTKCTDLKLISEKTNNGKAVLKYAAKDSCARNVKLDRFETIEMLKEEGFWKVNKITVSKT